MKKKEFIISIIFTTLSLVVYNFFPTKDNFQQVITMLIFFVILPYLFSRYFLHLDVFQSFKTGDVRNGLMYAGISMLAYFFIFLIAAYGFDFFDKYKIPVYITKSFGNFLLYEFALVLPFVFIYEFFFRGFILKFSQVAIGYWGILLQSFVFALLFFSFGTVDSLQYLPYLIFSPFAGYIYLKSGSLIYPAFTQFILILTLNAIVIQRIG